MPAAEPNVDHAFETYKAMTPEQRIELRLLMRGFEDGRLAHDEETILANAAAPAAPQPKNGRPKPAAKPAAAPKSDAAEVQA
jgi:hypothetical protein